MCGRYTLTAPDEVAAQLGDLLADRTAPALPPRYNVAPTQLAPVIANRPARSIELMRWGLVPRWADDLSIGSRMINARAESVATKPAFKDALARRRCLVPADGFYEWRAAGKQRQPLWIRREPRRLICFAGLWERWRPEGGGEPVHSFTIVTSAASPLVADLHDRMPVIVEPEDHERWLSVEPLPAEALNDILRPSQLRDLVLVPVSMAVNSPANDGPECVAPPAQPSLF
jgi:putative SOS response-associated peptidase YedK